MKETVMYIFNFTAIPKGVIDADACNALKAFIVAIDISINQKRYDLLPDWTKKYWMAKTL